MEKYKDELDRLCKEKKYTYTIHDNSVIINTPMDFWQVIEMDNYQQRVGYKPFLVRHSSHNTKKMKTHPQRYAMDLKYIFNNIIEDHETFGGVYAKMFNLNKIFKELQIN